ncbi:hypothetical protein PC129_g19074 [Phytophthora cactorum]|uniref:Uncharacterized protein n=1 Tax=Phytophthora cactorum TaxID=29920 RepID=A0A329RT92_9STRA|nr:hypothetical protein Pcac1_g17221 [Phytophthora cactorum]KAG2801114.1 hypothetical protein PC112_g20181 [Phytophthora cactorum]KAG2836376.1 hypothetical protein PC113_g20038 [Phytophthora cactorum]KAG2880335.1 hypothetical protein PC114_g22122 [Phytophthora cactorum]KAG2900631.1 hypothetical protein PC117_g21925 [Phytophthora cactorum]
MHRTVGRSFYQRLAYVERQNAQFQRQHKKEVLLHQLGHGMHVY